MVDTVTPTRKMLIGGWFVVNSTVFFAKIDEAGTCLVDDFLDSEET